MRYHFSARWRDPAGGAVEVMAYHCAFEIRGKRNVVGQKNSQGTLQPLQDDLCHLSDTAANPSKTNEAVLDSVCHI
jgi:hypothetical protein